MDAALQRRLSVLEWAFKTLPFIGILLNERFVQIRFKFIGADCKQMERFE